MIPKLPRYSAIDVYTLEELRREYQSSTARGRIRLLRKLLWWGLPDEIARIATEDSHVEVRQWLAKNALREDLGVFTKLRSDPDFFIRACVYENRDLYWSLKDSFGQQSHLERLAYLRNRGVDRKVVESVFDLGDQTLGLDFQSRHELAAAYLTNADALLYSDGEYRRNMMRGVEDPRIDVADLYRYGEESEKHISKLWKLASKWPKETGVPVKVYRYVGAPDQIKEEVYKVCSDPALRCVILENCAANLHPKTLRLGLNDPDDACSRLARKALNLELLPPVSPFEKTLLDVAQEYTAKLRLDLGLIALLFFWRVWPVVCVVLGSLFAVIVVCASWSRQRQVREHVRRVYEAAHIDPVTLTIQKPTGDKRRSADEENATAYVRPNV